ncbi:MAG: hypothetical protein LBU12_08695, partial [Deltaproteobacteria bacterium]|nr:hypothetical protein [Deltaproteobacteria bacterium]
MQEKLTSGGQTARTAQRHAMPRPNSAAAAPSRRAAADRPLRAAVLTTGSELMLGAMTDTNSAWLSARLAAKGVETVVHQSAGDDLELLVELFADGLRRCEVVVATGGLGPTEDDLTRLAAARAFGRKLRFRPELAAETAAYMSRRGFAVTANNFRQAWTPDGALAAPNPWGTAPVFCLEAPDRLMFFLPGVPQEMKNLTRSWVEPKLEAKFGQRLGVVKTFVLRAVGLGESAVDALLSDLLTASENPRLGLLAGSFETKVTAVVRARSDEEARRLAEPLLAEMERRLGPNCLGRRGQTIFEAVGELLAARGLRLALADSLTEGRAAALFSQATPPAQLAGAISAPPERGGAIERLAAEELGADLVGILSLRPAEGPAEGPTASAVILAAPGLSSTKAPGPGGLVEVVRQERRLLGA